MAIKFLNNIQAEAENTPDIIVKDTTNGLIGRLRAANNYVYLTADHGDSVGSTRITFQVDGDAVGFFSNSLFTAETSVKFSSYGSGTNTGTATYALSVDANGNIIEGSVQSNPAGVDGTGTIDYLTKWLDGDTLTDSNVYEASGDLITTLNLKSSSSYPQLKLTDTDNSTTSSIRSAGGTLQHVLHDDTKAHVFYAGGTSTELMRITGDGLVGIGQSNPVENLEVYDASANAWVVVETGLNNAGTQYINTTSAWTVGIKANDSDSFYIGNQEGLSNGYLILDTSGNLQLTSYTAGYLKSDADGNITVDTSIIEDTLDSVTDRNATTTNAITVGGLTVDTNTLHVDATNNRVGIGTTSPSAQLEISGSSGGEWIRLTRESGRVWAISRDDQTTAKDFSIEDVTAGTRPFLIAGNTGYIGIGTDQPTQKLHISGNFRLTGEFIDSNNSGGLSGQILSSTGTGTDWVSLSEIQGVDGTGTANYLAKWSDIDTITDSVVYDDGTNVGIGTTSPSRDLHIYRANDGGQVRLQVENNSDTADSTSVISIYNGGADGGDPFLHWKIDAVGDWSMGIDNSDSDKLKISRNFGPGTNDYFTLDTLGNVGIGTTAPNHKLEVAGNVGVDNYIYHNGDTNTYIKFDNDQITLYAGNHSVLSYDESTTSTFELGFGGQADTRIGAGNAAVIFQGGSEGSYDGKVGIGTTTPSSTLTVNGAIEILKDDVSSDVEGGHITLRAGSNADLSYRFNIDNYSDKLRFFREDDSTGSNGVVLAQFSAQGNLQLNQYTTGVLVTDASGNVTASTDYHTQDTADARYVNVTGDTMTGGLNIEISASNTQLKLKRTTSATGEFNIYTNTDSLYFQNVGQSTYPMMINSSGNVGIGTTNPGTRLHIHSDTANALGIFQSGDNRATIRLSDNDTDGYWHTQNSGTQLGVDSSYSSNNLTVRSGGNVGVGTTNPTTKLYVDGGESTFNRGNSDGAISRFRGKNNEKAVIGTLESWFSSKVGIGTTSPSRDLHIYRANDGGQVRLQVENNSDTADSTSVISIYNGGADGGDPFLHWKIDAVGDWSMGIDNSDSDKLKISRNFGPGTNDYFTLDTLGNVGIGTNDPVRPLHLHSASNTQMQFTDNGTGATDTDGLRVGWNGSVGQMWLFEDASLRFATNNSEKVRITSGGNVGIGTTNPGAKLDIRASTSSTEPTMFLQSGTSGVYGMLATEDPYHGIIMRGVPAAYNDYSVTASDVMSFFEYGGRFSFYRKNNLSTGILSEIARIDYQDSFFTSNVGIGTTSPEGKLDVAAGNITAGIKGVKISGNTSYIADGSFGTSLDISHTYSSNDGSFRAINVDITDAGTLNQTLYGLYVNAEANYLSGNVGIGTTSPQAALHINKSGVPQLLLDAGDNTTGDIVVPDGEILQIGHWDNATSTYTDRLRMNIAGQIGINTQSPNYQLTVVSDSDDIGIVTASTDSGSYIGFIDNSTTVATMPKVGAVGNKLILSASQYVGVLRTDPSYALDVSGTIRATGDVIAFSDARIKENVETIPNALDKVKAMRGVEYNKIGEEKRSVGVIAQEMLEVMPEVVHQDDAGMYSVGYGNLVGVLIEAVKDLEAKVKQLETKLDGTAK